VTLLCRDGATKPLVDSEFSGKLAFAYSMAMFVIAVVETVF
jgi:hypothetical protein